jgi:hypothetical protein
MFIDQLAPDTFQSSRGAQYVYLTERGKHFAPMELKPYIFKLMVYKHLIPTGLGHVYPPIL